MVHRNSNPHLWSPLCSMTKMTRFCLQAVERNFALLRDRARSSVTWEELGEPLLLHMKKSQLRWLGHLFVCLFRACATKRRPRGKPRTCWGNYISRLAWEHLGIPLVELEEGRGRGKSGYPCSDSYPGDPAPETAEKTDRLPVSKTHFFSKPYDGLMITS